MTDKLHQSLSSVMDGAGDDLELPRLLNVMQAASPEGQALSHKWRRYHLAQGVLRGELRGMQNPKAAQVDISAAVMQALEEEQLTNFTDASAASELNSSPSVAQAAKPKAATPEAALSNKHQERGQWWRGGALAASVALLVITGTQIYNFSQKGETRVNSFAAQEAVSPITRPNIQASQVVADCQYQLFSGTTLISFPNGLTGREPCASEGQAYSPLVSSPAANPSSITPVSSR